MLPCYVSVCSVIMVAYDLAERRARASAGMEYVSDISLQWRHNGRNSVSNHQPRECLLSRLVKRRSRKTSKLRITGLCAGNSPETGEFPAQRANDAENVSIWWRHHVAWHKKGSKTVINHVQLLLCGAIQMKFVVYEHPGPFLEWKLANLERSLLNIYLWGLN